MDDANLVDAARRGDREAWGLIYDRYADRLHDHCWSILRDEHEASDALHDAFVNAARALPQLRDPSRLRPWLYAIARNEAFRRHRARRRVVPTDDLGEIGEIGTVTVDLDAGSGAPVDDLRRLVWDAAGGLSADDQALLDLHLRQGLEGEDLAEAMGITANNAYVKMSRLRDTLERSLGALLVARTGRRDCPDLAAVLAGWDGQLTPLLRKRIARHIDTCDTCGERKKAMVSPLAMFAGMPLVPAPSHLREHILDDAVAAAATAAPPAPDILFPAPPAEAPATMAVPVAVPIAAGPPGTPPPDGSGDDSPNPWWWVLGGVAALIVVAVGLLLAFGGDDGDVVTDTSTTTSSSTSTSSTSTSSTSSTTSSTTSTTSTSTTVAAPVIGLNTSGLDFGATATDLRFRISNTGGSPFTYSVAATPSLGLSRSGGTLDPGTFHEVVVSLDRSTAREGAFTGRVTITSAEVGTHQVPVRATIAFRPPVIEAISPSRDFVTFPANPSCPTTVTVTYRDESAVRGTLHWATDPGSEDSVAMTGSDGQLVGTLGAPLTPGAAYEFWVVLVDANGASTGEVPADHQPLDIGTCP
jgi:RNA polymerase sigma factor (sigma-70 family)